MSRVHDGYCNADSSGARYRCGAAVFAVRLRRLRAPFAPPRSRQRTAGGFKSPTPTFGGVAARCRLNYTARRRCNALGQASGSPIAVRRSSFNAQTRAKGRRASRPILTSDVVRLAATQKSEAKLAQWWRAFLHDGGSGDCFTAKGRSLRETRRTLRLFLPT